MTIERFRLDDRIAVVTGGGRGIGFAISSALAEAGATVIIAEINAETGNAAAEKLQQAGHKAEFLQLNVADSASVRAAAEELIQRHERIDVLVNNAGICINAGALETTDEIWDKQMAVNQSGLFYCCREFGRYMVERGSGSIVNLSSIAAVIDIRPQHHIAYSATKAAVTQMTKVLASEWASHGVRVNALGPGYVATDMPMAGGKNQELLNTWLSYIPIGRMIEPDEVAAAALFLASDASSSVTGHLLMTDGGYTVW